MIDSQDYYTLLGVRRDADERAIKQAFRQLARQCHPDMRPRDSHAEEQFKRINEAYQVLANPDLRRAYDARPRPPDKRGRDIELAVEISLEDSLHGTTRVLPVQDRWIEARIPPGVRSRSRVRLRGQGEPGSGNGAPGDLYLLVQVCAHERFRRNGDDIHTDVAVDVFTAAAGGSVQLDTLDGPVLLRIPLRTQSGTTFRLSGRGLPRAARPTERGHLYARVLIVLPEALSDHEVAALRELGAARGELMKG